MNIVCTSPSPERQTAKKRRTGKGNPGASSTLGSEIKTTITNKLVEVTNIVAFANGTEEEKARLLATLSTDDLGIFSDYTTSGLVVCA